MVTKSLAKTTPLFSSKANGIEIGAGLEVEFELVVAANIAVEIVDKFGKVVTGSCNVPADVTALLFVYVDACIQVKVAAVSRVVGDLLHRLLGLVLVVVKCLLF
jgi:hypothetical protein